MYRNAHAPLWSLGQAAALTLTLSALAAAQSPVADQETTPTPAAARDASQPRAAGQPEGARASVEHAEEIHANYDDTIEIYGQILERERTDTGALDRRIEANEQLIERYKPKLAHAEQALRGLRVTSYKHALALKTKFEAGEISEATYRKELGRAEADLERRRKQLEEDVNFYREEIETARARLAQLRVRRQQVAELARTSGLHKPTRPAPGDRLLNGLVRTLDALAILQTPRLTMDDNERCRRCNIFRLHAD